MIDFDNYVNKGFYNSKTLIQGKLYWDEFDNLKENTEKQLT
jgi:hypothetical protein